MQKTSPSSLVLAGVAADGVGEGDDARDVARDEGAGDSATFLSRDPVLRAGVPLGDRIGVLVSELVSFGRLFGVDALLSLAVPFLLIGSGRFLPITGAGEAVLGGVGSTDGAGGSGTEGSVFTTGISGTLSMIESLLS